MVASKTVQLVGGPYDGQLQAVPSGMDQVIVQVMDLPVPSIFSKLFDKIEPVPTKTYVYRPRSEADDILCRWRCDDE